MSITVICSKHELQIDGQTYPCRVGRRGAIAGEMGREGDEKTPLGTYHLRFGFYRADRLPGPPLGKLQMWPLKKDDGWCDDPDHPAYNRFVALPFNGSHEKLWRDDGAYDVIIVMSHNDSPPVPGLGSAVFLHIAQPDDRQTLGCIAVTPDVMVRILKVAEAGMSVDIRI